MQGGGFRTDFSGIPENPPIMNEANRSNVRGTIGMARLAGDPNSGTNQWFINLSDNVFLDEQGGGFTVFGDVVGNGMQIIDAIAALPTVTDPPPFGELPVVDPMAGRGAENLVVINSVRIVPEPAFGALTFASMCIFFGMGRRYF